MVASAERRDQSTHTRHIGNAWTATERRRRRAWISATPPEELFLSAVIFGELQAAVEMTRQQDPAKAEAIESWIEAVAATHNILPADGVLVRRWAQLMHHRSADFIEDAIIAATALVHNMTVATRSCGILNALGFRL